MVCSEIPVKSHIIKKPVKNASYGSVDDFCMMRVFTEICFWRYYNKIRFLAWENVRLGEERQLDTKYLTNIVPAGNYMFKVNNRNTGTRCEICSKLTIKIPERRRYFYCKL